MKTTCTGRKVSLKPSFEEKVEKRLNKLNKFFSDQAEAHVTVVVEKNFQRVEITVKDGSFVARAERCAEAMEEAFELAADVLTKNIVKNRKKLSDKMQKAIEQTDYYESFDSEEEDIYHLIREKRFAVKPSTIDEAILQMNLLGHNFYLFLDAESNDINAVYARKDGSYGVLIPER